MKRYRIRRPSGRVVGPFLLEEISKIANQGHINGGEKYQEFPTGDWKDISELDKDDPLLDSLKSFQPKDDNSEATFIRNLSDIDLHDTPQSEQNLNTDQINFPKEFNYLVSTDEELENKQTTHPDLEDNKNVKTNDEKSPNNEVIGNNEEEAKKENKFDKQKNNEEENESSQKEEELEDKTIINVDTLDYLKKLKELEEKKKLEDEEKKRIADKKKLEEVDLENDSTQFLNLDDIKIEITEGLIASEKELEKEKKEERTKEELERKRIVAKEKARKKELEDDEEEDDEQEGRKSKKILFLIIGVGLIFILLSPEEKKQVKIPPINIQDPKISFPVEVVGGKKRSNPNELYKQGLRLLYKGGYKNRTKAAEYLKKSVEYKYNNNPAIAWLIYTYSYLLKNSNSTVEDQKVIFNLIQLNQSRTIMDKNLTAAKAYFFHVTDKNSAAVKTIENFAAIKGNKPSLEVLLVYLESLAKSGNIAKASQVKEKLENIPKKSRSYDYYNVLFDYYFVEQSFEKAINLINEAEKKFKNDTGILLKKSQLLVYKEDYNSLKVLLKKIRLRGLEGSKVYYSKYLEYKAMTLAFDQKVKEAAKVFKKALSVHESSELRSRLATLGESDNGEVNRIIVESKAEKLMGKAKAHLKKLNYKFASLDALEAKSVAPNYIPAKIFLAEIQIKQGLFQEAIKGLEKLFKEYPDDSKVAFQLADAYIESYKLNKAKRLITSLAVPENKNNPTYYSISAKYYLYKEDFSTAIRWLQSAINANPLNDENIYKLAQLFVKYRKYKQATSLLKKCIELDPSNVNYRVSYGDIIYEQDGTEQAIGYLLNVLKDFPDNPKVLGTVAIYYYKSGQLQQFKTTLGQLKKIPAKDTSLYEYLIKAAKLNEKFDDVITYSNKLIEINPGDLKVRLFLGQIYMEQEKYKEALSQFNEIKSRLDTYPKLQFYMSKLYLLTGNIEKATELANNEIKSNPGNIDGYILLGNILRKEKKYIEAENFYKKAQKIDRNNVDILVGLSVVNFKKSQYISARDLLIQARKLDPSRPEIHKLLGDVYRASQQSSLAIESYQLFLELSPNSSYKNNLEAYINMMK